MTGGRVLSALRLLATLQAVHAEKLPAEQAIMARRTKQVLARLEAECPTWSSSASKHETLIAYLQVRLGLVHETATCFPFGRQACVPESACGAGPRMNVSCPTMVAVQHKRGNFPSTAHIWLGRQERSLSPIVVQCARAPFYIHCHNRTIYLSQPCHVAKGEVCAFGPGLEYTTH